MPGTDSKLFSGGQLLALSVLRVFTVCLVYCGPPTANADVGQVWAVARVDSHLTERWAGQLLARIIREISGMVEETARVSVEWCWRAMVARACPYLGRVVGALASDAYLQAGRVGLQTDLSR